MNVEIKNVPVEVANDIWNAAIEEAVKIVVKCNREGPYNAIWTVSRIRKLKK
jgi:hypothetical protein